MQITKVPLRYSILFFKSSWHLVKTDFFFAFVVSFVVFMVAASASFVPVIGPFISGFLHTYLYAGLLKIQVAWIKKEPYSFADLFFACENRELRERLMPLAMLFAVLGFLTSNSFGLMVQGGAIIPSLTALIGALITLALYFLVPLVQFDHLKLADAAKRSVEGVGDNLGPILVAALFGIFLALLATVPLGLGWIVFFPVTIFANYFFYASIYQGMDLDAWVSSEVQK